MDLSDLRKPIDCKWKVQTASQWGCTCVSYIDARQVYDRLDQVCNPGLWQSDFRKINNKLFGGIGIKIENEWVWKWDIGTESYIEKEKGHASDAIKRAGVQWGIGRFLYSLDTIRLKSIKGKANKYLPCDNDSRIIYDVTRYVKENCLDKITPVEDRILLVNYAELDKMKDPGEITAHLFKIDKTGLDKETKETIKKYAHVLIQGLENG